MSGGNLNVKSGDSPFVLEVYGEEDLFLGLCYYTPRKYSPTVYSAVGGGRTRRVDVTHGQCFTLDRVQSTVVHMTRHDIRARRTSGRVRTIGN